MTPCVKARALNHYLKKRKELEKLKEAMDKLGINIEELESDSKKEEPVNEPRSSNDIVP